MKGLLEQNPPEAFGKGLLNPKEISAYLRIHTMTVYRLAKEGKLPMVKVGGRWRAKQEHIAKIGEHYNGRANGDTN